MKFEGIYTAIITPFTQGGTDIDYDAYEKLIERQVAAGVTGVVPVGTTGESPTLSHREHEELISRTVQFVKGRVQVLAGTGSNSTEEAIHLTNAACDVGVDAVMLVSPYYNKPNQEGLYQHFKTVAESCKKPVVLYNIKGRTGVNVEVSTMKRLAEVENIVAVKEASGDPGQMIRLYHECGDKLSILSGDDNITPAVMGLGGRGVVSVASNLYPVRMVRMMGHYLAGDFQKGNEIFYELVDVMNAMFYDTNPIPVKAAAHIMGLIHPDLRLPLVSLDEEKTARLKDVLARAGEDR